MAAPTPNKEILDALAGIRQAENSGATEFLALVDKLRREVVLAIVQNNLSPVTMATVKGQVSSILQVYQTRFEALLSDNQRRMFVKGLTVVDKAVDAAGLHLSIPFLSERTLGQVQSYGAELISGLTDYARQRITSEISLAVLGQKSVDQVIQAIGTNLDNPSVFGSIANRADIIFRTEVARISSLATIERIDQAKTQIPDLQKQWLHAHVGTPRPGHLALNGVTVAASEQFKLLGGDGVVYLVDGPHDPELPAGEVVNCFVGEGIVDARGIQRVYRSSYSGQLVTIKTRRGHNLTGTPNHPILTPRGFVALGELQQGDDVLSCDLGKGVGVTDPDIAYVPMTLEQIFNSSTRQWVNERVLGSSMDFYGDRSVGEIEIVTPDGQLMGTLVPAREQPLSKLHLVGRHFRKGMLSRDRFLAQFLLRSLRPAASNMSRVSETSPIDGGQFPHSDRGGGMSVPWFNPTLRQSPNDGTASDTVTPRKRQNRNSRFEHLGDGRDIQGSSVASKVHTNSPDPSADRLVGNAKALGDLVGTLSGNVSPDNITLLFRREIKLAHVFTLQTVSGLYNNNGIICRNCKCTIAPFIGRFNQDEL
jgi:hypothetical protein